jgi:hypothetical protein
MPRQTTDTILMIEPAAFGYNEQTAGNNYFQHRDNADSSQHKALLEFRAMVGALRARGVRVIVEKDTPVPHTPDSIFPNNWVSFHEDGAVILYPMFAENRRAERRPDILKRVEAEGFVIKKIVDYSTYEVGGRFLEGTGSMVLDRANGIAYAALSERTSKDVLRQFSVDNQYITVMFSAFQTVSGRRLPIYHTNVMMCVADAFAVVCLGAVDDARERQALVQSLTDTRKEIIEITETQMHCFAGNMLQIENGDGTRFLVMSETAYSSLTEQQVSKISAHNEILRFAVPVIEKVGGGGVRCMMGEVFLERRSKN